MTTSPCDDGSLFGAHNWEEVYYGTECTKCKTFYPHGCAPWDEDVREGFDFGDDSEEDGDYEPEDEFCCQWPECGCSYYCHGSDL